MPDWLLTVIQCPNNSGILLPGVQCWAGGALHGTTDVSGQVTLSTVTTYSLFKTGYQVGLWAHPGSEGSGSTCLILSGGGGGGGTDPGAPDPPSDLVAVPVSDTEIELTWSDNSSDETGFAVERSPDGVLDWEEVDTVGAGVTTHTDTGLAAGTTYYYRVRAFNDDGYSGYTDVANATTTGGGMAAPTAPSELEAEAVSASRIRLTWRDNSSDETGFRVERSGDGLSGWVEVGTAAANATSWVNTGLEPETPYYYRVRAYNADGNSAYTSVASAETLAAGEGECANTPYATVADVQGLIWSTNLTISDSSEPAGAQVEDWLCQETERIDSMLCWRYVVPITDASDRNRLRTPCSLLVASLCWEALVTRNPGFEERVRELRAAGLSQLVANPGGLGTWLRGGAAIISGKDPRGLGRALIDLPNSVEASGTGPSRRNTPVSNLGTPGDGDEPERLFTRSSEL